MKTMSQINSSSVKSNSCVENRNVEFKSSSVYVAEKSKAAECKQMEILCKVICSFLNTDGGCLYIGKDDEGNVITDGGIHNDMRFHKIKTVDSFARQLQDKIWSAFKNLKCHKSLISVQPDAEYPNDVVVVEVKECDSEVVYIQFDGKKQAFHRCGPTSRPMNSDEIKIRANKLVQNRKVKNNPEYEKRSAIENAIENKQQVILKQYRSSRSNTIKDRLVEPVSIENNGAIVWCYEIETGMNKSFKLCRVKYVELKNDKWQYEKCHEVAKVDKFNWSAQGDYNEQVEFSIYVNIRLKNELLETFKGLKECDFQDYDGDFSVLNTYTYNLPIVASYFVKKESDNYMYPSENLQLEMDKIKEEFTEKVLEVHNTIDVENLEVGQIEAKEVVEIVEDVVFENVDETFSEEILVCEKESKYNVSFIDRLKIVCQLLYVTFRKCAAYLFLY